MFSFPFRRRYLSCSSDQTSDGRRTAAWQRANICMSSGEKGSKKGIHQRSGEQHYQSVVSIALSDSLTQPSIPFFTPSIFNGMVRRFDVFGNWDLGTSVTA